MTSRPFTLLLAALAASAALTVLPGCATSEEAAAISQNLSDAEIRIDAFETRDDFYALRGTVVSLTPVAGSEAMAGPGEEITLTPYFPGGRPNPGNPAHSRLLTLPNVPPGSRIRCKIGLDSGGAWRIVAIE